MPAADGSIASVEVTSGRGDVGSEGAGDDSRMRDGVSVIATGRSAGGVVASRDAILAGCVSLLTAQVGAGCEDTGDEGVKCGGVIDNGGTGEAAGIGLARGEAIFGESSSRFGYYHIREMRLVVT